MEALAEAEENDLLKMWEGLGYYSRARNLQAGVREVCRNYGGEVPSNRKEISTLKGVGPYTAGAVLSIATVFQSMQLTAMSCVSFQGYF